jgi:hypothetical protein
MQPPGQTSDKKTLLATNKTKKYRQVVEQKTGKNLWKTKMSRKINCNWNIGSDPKFKDMRVFLQFSRQVNFYKN